MSGKAILSLFTLCGLFALPLQAAASTENITADRNSFSGDYSDNGPYYEGIRGNGASATIEISGTVTAHRNYMGLRIDSGTYLFRSQTSGTSHLLDFSDELRRQAECRGYADV